MKTITLTDDQHKFLSEMVKRMLKQGNRATQYPLFVIQVKEKEYTDDGDICERIEEFDPEDLCENCKKLYESDQELPDECNDCDETMFVWYRWKETFDLQDGSFFFTEKACEDHIAANHYHYNDPKSYVISAWRNPEIQTLMKLLFTMLGEKIPSHYL